MHLICGTRPFTSALAAPLLLILVLGLPKTASGQFGIAAGLNFDNMSDISAEREATFDNATGFHVGIFYDLPLGAVALRPGLIYTNVGDIDVESTESAVRSLDLSLIEVPVDLRLRMMMPFIKPYGMAGPVLRFASSSDDAFEESLNNFSIAANIGLGLEIGAPGAQIRLFPEIRYAFGISSLTEDVSFLGQEFDVDDDVRLNTFMLRLGVAF
ncbi:MAG: outer membrane beta-barrel protein [Rhodothermales bacterium]